MERIKELEEKIAQARHDYYNDQAKVSDTIFDAWIDELAKLDPLNKQLIYVGAEPISEWEKYEHKTICGSLNKCNTPEEFIKWSNDYVVNNQFFITPKLDGLSVVLIYEDGKLTIASSRGSGKTGENITANVVKMQNVPLRLSKRINATVRGEIILNKENHQKFFQDYSNARNAAAGVSRRLDGEGSEHLEIIVYQLTTDDLEITTEEEQFQQLKHLKFTTPYYWMFNSTKEVIAFKENFQEYTREQLPMDTDGLVIRQNNLALQEEAGFTHARPKAAIAYKFQNAGQETTIKELIWQVGNTGHITPVAILEPVELVGAVISRATLHNPGRIKDLGLDIGAKIIVERAGDVIPFVAELVEGTGTIAKSPIHCPSCHGKLLMRGEYLTCPNTDQCPEQVKGRIKNWVGELNILELGEVIIEKLVDANLVKTPADLYTLTVDELAQLDRLGEKSAQNIYNSIWKNNPITLDLFLGALTIPLVGPTTIRLLMENGYDTLDQILQVKAEELGNIKGMGPAKINSLVDGLKKNKKLIGELLKNGVKIKEKAMGKLTGKSICITGSTNIKRADLAKMIAEAGGTFKSSVGANLTYLVMADTDSQSTKAVKARKLGTQIITEEQLISMIS